MSSDCRKGWEQGLGCQKGSRLQVSQAPGLPGLGGAEESGFCLVLPLLISRLFSPNKPKGFPVAQL